MRTSGGAARAISMAARNRSNRSVWSGQTQASSQRVAASSSSATGAESIPRAPATGGSASGTGTSPRVPHESSTVDGGPTLAARLVAVLVAVEQEVEPGAGADVEVGQMAPTSAATRPNAGSSSAQRPISLVCVRRVRSSVVELGGSARAQFAQRRHRVAGVRVGGQVGVVAGQAARRARRRQRPAAARARRRTAAPAGAASAVPPAAVPPALGRRRCRPTAGRTAALGRRRCGRTRRT